MDLSIGKDHILTMFISNHYHHYVALMRRKVYSTCNERDNPVPHMVILKLETFINLEHTNLYRLEPEHFIPRKRNWEHSQSLKSDIKLRRGKCIF